MPNRRQIVPTRTTTHQPPGVVKLPEIDTNEVRRAYERSADLQKRLKTGEVKFSEEPDRREQ